MGPASMFFDFCHNLQRLWKEILDGSLDEIMEQSWASYLGQGAVLLLVVGLLDDVCE